MPSVDTLPAAEEAQFVTYTAGATVHKRPILRGSAKKPTFSRIPDIDCSRLLSPNFEDRKALAEEIGKAVREVGFFYAHNVEEAGVSRAVMDEVFAGMAEFFALPVEEKLKVHTHKSPAARGYEPLLETRADVKTKGDLKESFIIGEDPLDQDQAWIGHRAEQGDKPMNIWLEGQDRFRKAFQAYYRASYVFGQHLLRIYSLALGLDEHALDRFFEFPTANANCLHYPPQDQGDEEIVGLAAHYSLFTLVLQQGVAGIQILNDNGEWVNGEPKKYTYLVNVGDYLSILTNGKFRSTVHRVVNVSNQERYSLPMFFSPDWRSTIRPLPDLLREGEEPKHEAIEVQSMHVHRIFATRFKHPTAALIKEKGIPFEGLRYSMLKAIRPLLPPTRPHNHPHLTSPLRVPSVSVIPATPELSLSSAHNPYGGIVEAKASEVSLSVFEDDPPSPVEEKTCAADARKSFIPPSRRFLQPDQPRLSALLSTADGLVDDGMTRKRRIRILKAAVIFVLLALAIGLGVGLSQRSAAGDMAKVEGKSGIPPSSVVVHPISASEMQQSGTSIVTSALLTVSRAATAVREAATATSTPSFDPAGLGWVGGGDVGTVQIIYDFKVALAGGDDPVPDAVDEAGEAAEGGGQGASTSTATAPAEQATTLATPSTSTSKAGRSWGWKELNGRRSMYWGGTLLPSSGSLVPAPFPPFMDAQWPNVLDRIAGTGVYDEWTKEAKEKGLKGKEIGPNHCLVNEYLPSQGIMPHTDGPAYLPCTTTLSLGSHTVLCLRSPPPHLNNPSSTSPDDTSPSAPAPVSEVQKIDLFLPPRSLLVLTGDLYSTWLHGIQPLPSDTSEVLRGCANWNGWWEWQKEAASAAADEGEEGGAAGSRSEASAVEDVEQRRKFVEARHGWERTKRVSLTCRRVAKVRKGLFKLG
ncbi:hypothetical protein JCM8097_006841 [Rhodosporidiobolus ruineniae]